MSPRADLDVVEAAFTAALSAGESSRHAVIAANSGGDPRVRAEVEALLAAHAHAGAFLSDREGDLTSGTMVGSFRLLERIGQGGMGDVYRAERAAADFTQRVAVKVISARLHGTETIRRFRDERQILASLQHPNIVSLVDGGVTAAGQPYLVMEYVDGICLTEYCACHGLSIRDRLGLFRQLLAAVAHAHRHLVVHRDLKPANVLVTKDGLVKVLDFGVAKLLEGPGGTAPVTRTILGPMTPEYASPEQMRGLPVTTQCDVYSLGVLLFEVLTGRRPFDTSGKDVAEIVRTVTGCEPPRPSAAAAGVPYPASRLRGDLDAIVLTALAREPARRYASAMELDGEIERYLQARPIVARRPTVAYLARRAVARHRVSFAVGTISALLLFAAFSSAIWQARIARRERQRAIERYSDVRELAGSIVLKLHDEVEKLPGSTPVRRAVLSEGIRFLERLEPDAANDPALRVQLAEGYRRIGDVLGRIDGANLGDREGAIRNYRRALGLVTPIAGAGGPVEALTSGARLNLALSHALDEGDPEKLASVERAFALASERLRREPGDGEAQGLLASVHFQFALSKSHADSLPHWLEARRLFEAALAQQPDAIDKLRNVALVEKYLGGFYERSNDIERAFLHHSRAYQLDARRVDITPSARQAQIDLAIDLSNLANMHEWRGDYPRAIAMYAQSLEIRERLSSSDPSDVYARGRVAYVHEQLAMLQLRAGAIDLARSHVHEAIALNRSLSPIAPAYAAQHARALEVRARIEASAGRRAAACASYIESNALYRALDPGGNIARDHAVSMAAVRDGVTRCGTP